MTKMTPSTICRLVMLILMGLTSIASQAEQIRLNIHTTSSYATTSLKAKGEAPLLKDASSELVTNKANGKADTELTFAKQVLNTLNKGYPERKNTTKLPSARGQSITVSAATLMKPTNLPGRYLGNSRVTLVHY